MPGEICKLFAASRARAIPPQGEPLPLYAFFDPIEVADPAPLDARRAPSMRRLPISANSSGRTWSTAPAYLVDASGSPSTWVATGSRVEPSPSELDA